MLNKTTQTKLGVPSPRVRRAVKLSFTLSWNKDFCPWHFLQWGLKRSIFFLSFLNHTAINSMKPHLTTYLMCVGVWLVHSGTTSDREESGLDHRRGSLLKFNWPISTGRWHSGVPHTPGTGDLNPKCLKFEISTLIGLATPQSPTFNSCAGFMSLLSSVC